MSTTEIKDVVKSIKKLPASKRSAVASKLIRELKPETLKEQVRNAVESGHFNVLFAKAMTDYNEGRALDRIY